MARLEERAAVVAWLRSDDSEAFDVDALAAAIEAGEHVGAAKGDGE